MKLQLGDGEVRRMWIYIKGKGRDGARDPSIGKEVEVKNYYGKRRILESFTLGLYRHRQI